MSGRWRDSLVARVEPQVNILFISPRGHHRRGLGELRSKLITEKKKDFRSNNRRLSTVEGVQAKRDFTGGKNAFLLDGGKRKKRDKRKLGIHFHRISRRGRSFSRARLPHERAVLISRKRREVKDSLKRGENHEGNRVIVLLRKAIVE